MKTSVRTDVCSADLPPSNLTASSAVGMSGQTATARGGTGSGSMERHTLLSVTPLICPTDCLCLLVCTVSYAFPAGLAVDAKVAVAAAAARDSPG